MSSLPTVLEEAWNHAQPRISQIRTSLTSADSGRPRIIRVGQLDAELLDQELAQLLQEPINKTLSLINLTLYKLSVWNTGATYGARLQDLRYVVQNISSSRLAHAPSSDYRRKVWDALCSVESIYGLLGLANFVAFLWGGKYRTLADRILRMNLVPSRRLVKRDVSYEFMNRQMVWHAFTEFLLFLLPLINARTIRRRVYRLTSLLTPLYSISPFRSILQLKPVSNENSNSPLKRGKLWSIPQDQCAICFENARFNLNISEPTNMFTSLAASTDVPSGGQSNSEPPTYPIYNPYQTSCGHIYCYHCVAERMIRTADEADDELGWECLRCGEEVKEVHRYAVDVIESEVSESDYEFSSDLDMGTDLSGSMGSYSESGFSE
ncbi:Peroxisomal biogenesis factor 2 [Psilocybe cubensis]|uniref:Peroxisomal biogenesis factor 2 n=1 Tax=Psilocybe cubensis TaxID=181762 RepID=A0ACB8H4F1_PSICU|nr:Peroxisomal biogenesis factor 2 [Psilocybe cubensis]KAH9482381.1 Peroxisomal biogenesis factor 2 [Psilocybe cubensis]